MNFGRRPRGGAQGERPRPSGIPGVPGGWSTTYIVPEQREPGWPGAREPGARLRVVPNEVLLPGALGKHVGELTQTLLDVGADVGISVEIDTSDRTRPGEMRGGASPIEAIELAIIGVASGFAGRQLSRLQDRLFDAAVDWALRHRKKEGPPGADPISVTLYGADGEPIKSVLIPQGEGDAPPVDRLDPNYEPTGRD